MSEKAPCSSSGTGAGATASPAPTAATGVLAKPKKTLKRRRTRSHHSSPSPHGRGFFVPGFEESTSAGLKMMSLSEVMDAARGISNMFLAHEIAVDKDFMLEDIKPPETALEKQVKEVVHRAFWDILDQELKENPPVYTQALSLLKEVRESLLGLLVPQQRRLIENIKEKMDLELVAQQVENDAFNFQDYATYVVNLMGQLCAPVRDDEVAALRDISEIVPLFQGIMKTIDHMKLDMANFHIQQARPLIVSQSVEYEKGKFKDFLKTQEDGLAVTKSWLKRHAPPEDEDTSDQRYHKLQIQRVLTDAYLELLEWDDYNPLPETLVMDQKRVVAIRDATERTALSTAVILLTFSNISAFVVPMDAQKLKEKLKQHIDVLLEDFFDDTDLLKILPNVAVQVVSDVNDYLQEKDKEPLPDASVRTLEEQIKEMEDPNHRIRDLVQRRIVEFNKQAISTARSAPLQMPPGLTLCQKELAQIAGNYVRLVNYNRAVFGEFYTEIIENDVLFKPDDDKSRSRED